MPSRAIITKSVHVLFQEPGAEIVRGRLAPLDLEIQNHVVVGERGEALDQNPIAGEGGCKNTPENKGCCGGDVVHPSLHPIVNECSVSISFRGKIDRRQ